MNYYNEYDKKAAAWLRGLIAEGQIPAGFVDERSISDVRPNELVGYNQCHFFAGIGGWPLALRLASIPDDEPLWTGSCPCQPFSCAGKGLRESDERHLWPDLRNLIAHRRPPIVFGEQVASAAGREWLAGVRLDMAQAAYAFGAADLCAAGVGAPQRRQRFFWVAQSQCEGSSPEQIERKSRETETNNATARSGNNIDSMAEYQSKGRTGMEFERQTRIGKRARAGSGGSNAGVAQGDTSESGLEGHPRNGANGNEPGRNGTESNGPIAETGGDVDRMAHAGHGAGCTEQEQQLQECHSGAGQSGTWSDFRIVHTKDGKARRIPVEPAFFPLVDGFPARVAVLKGFGNAIVPQVAAEFIAAVFESLIR